MSHSRINPFIYGRAVQPNEFVGREKELRCLGDYMATSQSSAVIGLPHVGKTSLLTYVMDPTIRKSLWGSEFDKDVFKILDAQMLRSVKSQTEFWNQALEPLAKACTSSTPGLLAPVLPFYQTARDNNFGSFVLEELFEAGKNHGIRYILILDEFDDLLSHPVLNSAEFYGSLRSIASRSLGLVLVLGSRRDMAQLNKLTQEINPHGSPYFNAFTQITLSTLSSKAFLKLIKRAGSRFDQSDAEFIFAVSGLYPFLVQAAAAKLWEASEEGLTGVERYEIAGHKLYKESDSHFSDTWRVWSNDVRRAVTTVALTQFPSLLETHTFDISTTARMLDNYSPELYMLEDLGFLEQIKESWHIKQGAFLWWLADELKRNVRDEQDFTTWLTTQEIDGLFTVQQRENLSKVTTTVLELLGKGASTLIESLAKGVSEAAVKHI